MSDKPGLRDETWNPIVDGVTRRSVLDPLRWRIPRRARIGIDLFSGDTHDRCIALILAVARDCPQHQFVMTTSHPANVDAFLKRNKTGDHRRVEFPPNVWLGVSVEDQATAGERIPLLLQIPAVRWVSAEPLLGPVDLVGLCFAEQDEAAVTPDSGISWLVTGGETGPGARPMHPDWARGLRDQCVDAGVPFHFKQHGEWVPNAWSIDPDAPYERRMVNREAMVRVGKRAAGRELDGRTWEEYPDA